MHSGLDRSSLNGILKEVADHLVSLLGLQAATFRLKAPLTVETSLPVPDSPSHDNSPGDSRDPEIRSLRAALREARWQNYHLFNVQRQRAFHAKQREKDLVRDLKHQTKALQKAKKLMGQIREAVERLQSSVAGLLGNKRVTQIEELLVKSENEWEPMVPETILELEDLDRTEDHEESLRIPFLTPTVEIVICVHNALADVRVCLDSILARSPKLQRLILVNDGSDQETSAYLEEFTANTLVPTEIIRNVEPRGYTIAANQGLRHTHADYVVLLNSDTIVPHLWLETLIACGEHDPKIGILGPLSNAASWQSVPKRFADVGDWEVNELPEGITVDDVGCALLLEHEPAYPQVELINGFCFVIKRAVMNEIGYLDQETFPKGYGEENDYCLRARDAGFKLMVADNAYVFHAKSKSFTHERRRELSKIATQLLKDKVGEQNLGDACTVTREHPDLAVIREKFKELQTHKVPFRVLFLLDFKGNGGGTHSIVQETNGLCELGVFAQMAVREEHADFYAKNYPGYSPGRFYGYQSQHELVQYAGTFDVVVATLFTSVEILREICTIHPKILPGYYIQDYEPLFYEPTDALYQRARDSYHLVPNALCFAKTQWLCDTLKEKENLEMHKITPSIDHSVYSPAETLPEGPIVISAMIRPATPRRSPELTVDVLRELQREFGDRIQVVVFGCPDDDPFWEEAGKGCDFKNRGVLTRQGVAEVLRTSALFLDLSTYQAFGRTALEAMASGCVPMVPAKGGSSEFARDGENAFIVDTTDRDAILEAAKRFLNDASLRPTLRKAAIETAARFTVKAAAESEKTLFANALAKQP